MSAIEFWLAAAVILIFYPLPGFLAWLYDDPAWRRILLLNLLVGWTLIGWIVIEAWVEVRRLKRAHP
jgi:hypothetical protein